MIGSLDVPRGSPYLTDVEDDAAIRKVLDLQPSSTRALAIEAGVDEKLLRMIRDGDRALTPAVRDALRDVLRRWEAGCREAAGVLEAAAEREADATRRRDE